MATKKNQNTTDEEIELTKEELEQQHQVTPSEEQKKEKKKAPLFRKDTKFSISDYAKTLELPKADYKPQNWLPLSPAFQEISHLPGLPLNAISMVFGRTDVGKTTLVIEGIASCLSNGILPIVILTENKFDWKRAEKAGIRKEECLVVTNFKYLEEGIEFMDKCLIDQEEGRLPADIYFFWDSIGSTPSKAEFLANTEGKGKAMMETAKLLREKIHRYIWHRITNTRNADFPYDAGALFVCSAYPQSAGNTPPTLVHSGGDGIYLAASLVIKMGGVMSRSSKVTATKGGEEVGFAIRSSFAIDKNHITNVTGKGKILCTDHGLLSDDKAAIDAYKKSFAADWDLKFDKYWDSVSDD